MAVCTTIVPVRLSIIVGKAKLNDKWITSWSFLEIVYSCNRMIMTKTNHIVFIEFDCDLASRRMAFNVDLFDDYYNVRNGNL